MPAALFDLRTADRNAALHNVVRSRARRCLFRRQRAMRQRPRRTAPCTTTRACSARSSATPSASRSARRPSRSSRRSGGCRVAFQRKADEAAGRNLDNLLTRLSPRETLTVIRAFSYFSHLANIAEDRHHVRRRLFHERHDEPQEGSLSDCFARLTRARIDDRHDRPRPQPRLRVAGPHRPSHRGAAQEHARRRARHRRPAGRARHPAQPARAGATTRRSCARASCSCGRRASCGPRSSPCATRSRTR